MYEGGGRALTVDLCTPQASVLITVQTVQARMGIELVFSSK